MKLPKEMQKKEKSRPNRPSRGGRSKGSQFGSRKMRRRMQQQGIDMDPVDATRVIIEGPEKTLVIEQPEVVKMQQMGQEIYQVIGSAEERSAEEVSISKDEDAIEEDYDEEFEEDVKPTITENDIMLVAAQANVSKGEAESALNQSNGDIAKAILFLKNKP